MRSRGRAALALPAVLVLSAVAPAGAGAAERLYGVTQSNRLITFHSDSPGATRQAEPIKGLRGGEDIVGIDIRPADGRLYGVTSDSRLYTIAARSGLARPVVPAAFGGPLPGNSLGFDFAPGGQELRLVTDTRRNFRLDPDSGAPIDGQPALPGIQGDGDLTYAPGDSAGDAAPRVGASAYRGGRLFGIDTARDALVVQSPANEGILRTVGRLRFKVGGSVGFDVAEDGRAYATLPLGGTRVISLARIDLSSGRARPTSEIPIVASFRGRRADPVRALAAAGRVRDDRTQPRVRNRKLSDPRVSQLLQGRALRLRVSCNEACVIETQLLYRSRVVGGAIGVLGRRGSVTLRLRLSRGGRRTVRRVRPQRLDVGIQATDMAGISVRTKNYRR